jgi:hypothetical protein
MSMVNSLINKQDKIVSRQSTPRGLRPVPVPPVSAPLPSLEGLEGQLRLLEERKFQLESILGNMITGRE